MNTEPLTAEQISATHEGELREALLHGMEHGWFEVFATDQPNRFTYVLTDEGKQVTFPTHNHQENK